MNTYIAEQEFKKVFPKLYAQEKAYEDKFGEAVNKYTRMHQKLYPKHKDNPLIHAHPAAAKNPKLIPLKKKMLKYGEIYNNYGTLIVQRQREFESKYSKKLYNLLFDKYNLKKYC